MPLPEPTPIVDDYRIVQPVLDGTTRRELDRADRFRGLSAADAALLAAWCFQHAGDVVEIHTDVAVGEVPIWRPAEQTPAWERLATACHPLRIDVVALLGNQWWVLECKPDAGYVALGQLLTYGYYAIRAGSPLFDARLGVVTDQVQRCVRPVYDRYEIEVFEVGAILDQGAGV